MLTLGVHEGGGCTTPLALACTVLLITLALAVVILPETLGLRSTKASSPSSASLETGAGASTAPSAPASSLGARLLRPCAYMFQENARLRRMAVALVLQVFFKVPPLYLLWYADFRFRWTSTDYSMYGVFVLAFVALGFGLCIPLGVKQVCATVVCIPARARGARRRSPPPSPLPLLLQRLESWALGSVRAVIELWRDSSAAADSDSPPTRRLACAPPCRDRPTQAPYIAQPPRPRASVTRAAAG